MREKTYENENFYVFHLFYKNTSYSNVFLEIIKDVHIFMKFFM